MQRILVFSLLPVLAPGQPRVGPPRGALVLAGGGPLGEEIAHKFFELAGGLDAPIVIIPTAGEEENYDSQWLQSQFLVQAGARNVSILHTRDRQIADSSRFTEPIARARAVWISGGRQWRLVDAYLNTRTHRELENLLERGGVIGGTSAGATIQGSYLVRGAREGNHIMMAPGYETGFGFLRNVAIDQHLLRRKRENDLVAVIDRYPALLGIGIDESTAAVVQGDRLEVIGTSKVAIYDHAYAARPGGPRYEFLLPGEQFDLGERKKIRLRRVGALLCPPERLLVSAEAVRLQAQTPRLRLHIDPADAPPPGVSIQVARRIPR